MHLILFILSAQFLGLSPIAGIAPASASDSPAAQFYFSYPGAISQQSDLPSGYDQTHFNSPLLLGFEGSTPTLFYEAHLGTPKGQLSVFQGGTLGALIGGGPVKLGLGVEVENQSFAWDAPVGGGFQDTWRAGLVGGLSTDLGWAKPSFDLRVRFNHGRDISTAEGLKTRVGWKESVRARGELLIDSPFLLARGALAVHSLGGVAIASKEFAYYIPRQIVVQPEIGAGARFLNAEFWLKYTVAISQRNDNDSIEYLYQTPFYFDQLSNKNTLSGEIRWTF